MKTLIALLAATAVCYPQIPKTLSLKDAEAAALQNHPRIHAARLEAQASSEQALELRSGLFPLLSGNITGAGAGQDNTRIAAGALNNPTIFSRVGTGIQASQLITDFGRTNQLVAGARFHAAALTQNANATADDILLETDRAYYRALRAQSVLRVAQQTVQARQTVTDQVTALANSKLKSALDVSFAQVNLSEAKLLEVSAKNDVDAAFAELAAAMGEERPQTYELLDEPLPPPPPTDFNDLLNTAVQSRPELASLRADRDAAARYASAQKRLWLPSLSAVTALGLAPAADNRLPPQYAAAGLNISVPIFNAGLFSARRKEAEYQEQAASERIKDEQLQITRNLRVAWLDARTAWERRGLTTELVAQANQALDLAQARYQIGLSSIVEFSQAQLAQTTALIENVSANYDYQTRRAALLYQMGQLR